MVDVINKGTYLYKGNSILCFEDDFSLDNVKNYLKSQGEATGDVVINKTESKKNTIAYNILKNHNTSSNIDKLKIKFDALASHDITYVGIIQTAKSSGLEKFPLPYVLTNCHNSLCAVGGTINEDDHVFGLSAAKKYGGIFVPPHEAVIHQYMREMMSVSGNMILGSDSHTRYGALGTMAIGEGGPELVKQLLNKTYDINFPDVIAIYLEGTPKNGVGPQDVALSIIGKVFKTGFVKNKILEFVGPGVSNLSVDYRIGIDVMTTETTCLSSIWSTDEKVEEYYKIHGRANAYKKLEPGIVSYYDGIVKIDLGKIEPMIALPFHPSNVYSLKELISNPEDIFDRVEKEAQKQIDNPKIRFSLKDKIVDGKIMVDQGIIAGCSGGTYENIYKAARMLENHPLGNDYFNLSVYPASQPIYMELVKDGSISMLMESGAILKTAFCGPCFGAGDVPTNNGLSIRHTTRNFPNREGAKPGDGQIASVALMDSLSIAATALNGGVLTSATDIDLPDYDISYHFNENPYKNRVYNGYMHSNIADELKYGPNIADWPVMSPLHDNFLLKMVSVINDPVTTTDELIPSGETSSYRSNPLKLAEFTLSRKDPRYVGRAKQVQSLENTRKSYINKGEATNIEEIKSILKSQSTSDDNLYNIIKNTQIGSVIFAVKPGDGSAREQAASCQKVLGGLSNIAEEYATKRYKSNLINWGMIPFTISDYKSINFKIGEYIFVEGIREAIANEEKSIKAKILGDNPRDIILNIEALTNDEKDIVLAGCLINYYNTK
ncbi:MAG: hydratase [Clostridiaceae bacterium]